MRKAGGVADTEITVVKMIESHHQSTACSARQVAQRCFPNATVLADRWARADDSGAGCLHSPQGRYGPVENAY